MIHRLFTILWGALLAASLIGPAAAAEKDEPYPTAKKKRPATAQKKEPPPPCVTKHRGESIAQPKSLYLYEHRVYLTNGCKNTIRVQVCYKGTKSCVLPEVAAGAERMVRLGAKRGESSFQYTFVVQPIAQPKKKPDEKKKDAKKKDEKKKQ